MSAASTEPLTITSVMHSVATMPAASQSHSAASSINTASGSSVCSQSLVPVAAAPKHQSGKLLLLTDNVHEVDTDYCDLEPDSSPGSVTNDDDANLSDSAMLVSSPVDVSRKDTLTTSTISHSVLGRSSGADRTTALLQSVVEWSRPAIITSDAGIHNILPAFSSTTRAELLSKSTFALPCDMFPSPAKHSTNVFDTILAPPTTNSLKDYVAPVMMAESSTCCLRFLPATAAALCDTSTVSSPSFARSLCAAISTTAKRTQPLEPTITESSAADRQTCSISVPSLVSGLVQHNTIVTSSTPVMADVLQDQLSAAGLPVMRTARLADHAEYLNALLSQAQLTLPKPEALAGAAGRQQVMPNDLTVPVIAFLNLGPGTGSLLSVLPPSALQFKVSVSNESVGTYQTTGTLSSSVEQATLL